MYSFPSERMDAGVFKRCRAGPVNSIPSPAAAKHRAPSSITKEDKIRLSATLSPFPYFCAAITEMPEVKPTITVTNRL